MQWEVLLPRAMKVVLVIFIAIIAYRLIKVLIRKLLDREIEEEDPLVRRLREQRAQTLASLLGNVAAVSVFVVATLTILDIMLDNIGPILASFGIIGLAFSFGAQSLVKDVISGTFMLIEGQFGVGDVVKVSDVSGLVEKITLRTTVLRDIEGAVHIVPNGEITRVTNMTKAWSRAVLHVGVATGRTPTASWTCCATCSATSRPTPNGDRSCSRSPSFPASRASATRPSTSA
jgi:moderate conductance mechanosensitive channel